MTTGVVLNIQKYCIHDGPGIRTTVFLKGCPLACWWCHNPESRRAQPELSTVAGRCRRCGRCVEVCPKGAVALPSDGAAAAMRSDGSGADGGFLPTTDPARCTLCGACVAACPADARRMLGRLMSAAEVMDDIRRDRVFYDESGGGATFSGGEPLAQPDFLVELLRACRAEEIHTAVDTCGFAAPETLRAVARWTDLFLYDVKTLDEDAHRRHTGASNALILDNLEMLGRSHPNVWVRVPVVPGVNDSPGDVEAVARLARRLPGVRQLALLPYHALGSYKPGAARSAPAPPAPQRLAELADCVRALGVPARVGG